MSIKQVGLATVSVALIALIFFGKYKLATASLKWWTILLGGLVFAVSSPAQTGEK